MSLIFLVGGAFEGKKTYAKVHYPDARVIFDYHLQVREQLREGKNPVTEVQNLLQSLKSEEISEKGREPDTFSENRRDVVLISDEIGCGIIPLDPMERKWREYNGRVNCCIASEADEVIRIIAGISQKLK